jgi:hypothetical protein
MRAATAGQDLQPEHVRKYQPAGAIGLASPTGATRRPERSRAPAALSRSMATTRGPAPHRPDGVAIDAASAQVEDSG